MSISALGSNQQLAYTQFFASQPASNQVTGTQAATGSSGTTNNFFQAISNALSSLGASSTTGTTATAAASATASTGTTQTPQQALQAFTQSLLAAIQSQVSGQSATGSPTAQAGGHHHHHGGGGVGKLEAGIQDILAQLTAASASGTASATGTLAASTTGATAATGSSAVAGATATTGTATTNGTIASLQSSFNNLLSTDGISSSSTSLSSFLQTLEKNLQGSSVSGNVVQTQA